MIDTKLRVDDRPILSQGTKILKKEDVPYYLVMNPLGFSYARVKQSAKNMLELCDGIRTIREISHELSSAFGVDAEQCELAVKTLVDDFIQMGLLTLPTGETAYKEFSSTTAPYRTTVDGTSHCFSGT
jgi:hypothetical protein